MLIRVRGGTGGIREYLERGQKSGREFGRDELDQRLILSGDLAITDVVINDMQNDGERYLHVTLAFREDQLDRATLQAITEEFRHFALSAYKDDEYTFYAEAHLPKIKSYTNKQNGQEVDRKPHIHIIIPKHNMLSGTMLDPLYRPIFDKQAGRVIVPETQMRWLEAFQEHINNKYGLASPKDNPRLEYTDESTIIARYKGDIFKGERAELKDRILSAVLDRNITSFDGFRALVAEHGQARARHAGQLGEYMNVKPAGAAKGTNLKEHVFSREFIELPTDEKRRQLVTDARRQYAEPGLPRPSPVEIEQRLQDWHSVRARELKYLNPGSRKAYAAYQAADPQQRRALLDERQAAFYARHREDKDHDHRNSQERPSLQPGRAEARHRSREPNPSRPTREPPPQARHRLRGLSALDVVRIDGRSEVLLQADVPRVMEHERAERNHSLRRDLHRVALSDSVTGQLVRDRAEMGAERAAESTDIARIKAELDARRLLAHLSRTHGVTTEKYQVERARDGSERIKAGTRRLNVSDFLTKELHLPWKEAAAVLRAAHADQLTHDRAPLARSAPDGRLWQDFKRWQPAQREKRAVHWETQRDAEKARRAETRRQHQAEVRKVRNDRQLTPDVRQAALHSLAALRDARTRALAETFDAERKSLKARYAPTELYRAYLQERSQAGDVDALAELRRQRDRALAPLVPSLALIQAGVQPADRQATSSALLGALKYSVDRDGVVTYYDSHRNQVMRDTGQHVCIDRPDRAALEAGLRLSIEKFGAELAVTGSSAFKRSVAEIAVQHKLAVRFADPMMNEYATSLAAALQRLQPSAQGSERAVSPAGLEQAKSPGVSPTKRRDLER